MTNGKKFLDAYERIFECLRTKANSGFIPFYELLAKFETDVVVKGYIPDLRKYANLRNAIVHDRASDQVIADPRTDVVDHIVAIADRITSPPRAYPHLKAEVASFAPEDFIGKVATDMQRHSYSQVPVIKHNGVITDLLTSDTIVRWL